MSTPTFQDYLKYIKEPEMHPVIRLEWLAPDFSVLDTIEQDVLQTSGNLTISFDGYGERRSLNLTLYNVHKKYNININKLWFAQAFKLYLGIYIQGIPYYLPQGVFYITNPTQVSNPSEKTMTIQAVDKKGCLDGTIFGNIGYVYQILVNTNIYDAIKSILNLSRGNGLVLDSIPPNLTSYYIGKTTTMPNSTVVQRILTPYTLRAENSSNYWAVIDELCKMLGALCGYDENGQLVVEPSQEDLQDNLKPSLWDYNQDEFELLGSSVEYKFSDVYNTIIIIGDVISGTAVSAKVSNTNPLSDTSVQRIGEKIYPPIEDTAISTVELATERGQYEMKRKTIVQKAITINSTPLYHLKTNQIITLTDNSLDFDKQKFLIQSINIPLQIGGQMQITATSVNDLVFV